MKKSLLAIFCLAALLPQTVNAENSEWVEKTFARLKDMYSGFDVKPYAPTDEFVYMHEFFVTENDIDNKLHINADNLTYTLDRNKKTELCSVVTFVIKRDKSKVKPEEREEYGYEFSTKISNAYDPIIEGDFIDNIHQGLELSQFADQFLDPRCKALISRGGEYFMEVSNNLETGFSHPLTVLSEPTVNVSVRGSGEEDITMHKNMRINAIIASGYPYSDRLADYQSGEMVFSILNANNEEVFHDIMKLEASADSLKLEYLINKDFIDAAASPKYTFKMSGPLLKEDIVIEKEVLANYEALDGAIKAAEELSDSIMNAPDLEEFKENAEALAKAAEEAKAGLKLTVYEQDKIDKLALDLFKMIDDTREAIKEKSGITGITTNEKKTAVKSIENGQIVIKRNNRTYNTQGMELRKQ